MGETGVMNVFKIRQMMARYCHPYCVFPGNAVVAFFYSTLPVLPQAIYI